MRTHAKGSACLAPGAWRRVGARGGPDMPAAPGFRRPPYLTPRDTLLGLTI